MPTSNEQRNLQNHSTMRLLFASLLILSIIKVFAQDAHIEINSQVWKPFIKNFNGCNTPAFMAMNSKDAVRSPRDAKTIWNCNQYNKEQAAGDLEDRRLKRKRTLGLHFTEHIVNGNLVFDGGVSRTTYLLANGKTKNYFGRFHVVMPKEKGVCKILVDTDSSGGGTIGEKEFLAGKAME